MAMEATPSPVTRLNDCFPIGVGDVIEGVICAGAAGLAPPLAGAAAGASAGLSTAGIAGGAPVSSRLIAILNVPSTITTTLAPTSSERIFEVMVDGALAWPLAAAAFDGRPAFSGGGAAAAACAARRAAAMKLDVLTGSRGAAGISLMAFSDAAMRSDGEGTRADGL